MKIAIYDDESVFSKPNNRLLNGEDITALR